MYYNYSIKSERQLMNILDISINICEAHTEKEMSYYLTQAKREFLAMCY